MIPHYFIVIGVGGYWQAYVSPQSPLGTKVYAWCLTTFGEDETKWSQCGGLFSFYDQEYFNWFLLRWS